MKNRQKILPAVCCIALLSACASNQHASVAPWSIVPMTAVKNSSDKPEAMYQMGRYYQGQNRYDQAISAYQKALAADASFVEARNGLGVIYSRQGNYREAIEAFQAAIQQAPKAAHIYSNMGYAYYLQGQYAESVAALKQSTLLDPTNQRALNNLGLAYAKAGSKGESVMAFTQAANTVAPPVIEPAVASGEAASVAINTPSNNEVPATQLKTQKATELNPESQMLALPKDRGVIRPAFNTTAVVQVDSRVELVQLAPNVSELRMQRYSDVKPTQIAMDISNPDNPKKSRIEVANGNGLTGMAGKVGQFLRSQGYPAARLTNQKPFRVQITQIQYRDGHQAEAQLLRSSLPEAPELVQHNDMRADVSVRLVLGKDIVTQLAYFEGKRQKYQFVRRLDVSDS